VVKNGLKRRLEDVKLMFTPKYRLEDEKSQSLFVRETKMLQVQIKEFQPHW
jgi:hypothetical protein